MSNLKFLVLPKNIKLRNPGLNVAYQTDNVTVWENSKCLARAYIVHGAKIIEGDKESILTILSDEHFDPANTVILEDRAALNTSTESLAQQPDESVEFLKYANDEVLIRAVLKQDGYLVLSDYNYPGWKADILNLKTGQHSRVIPLQADYLFRAVGLKSGEYTVRFIFEPQSFYTGLKISVVTIIIVALALIWLRC